LKDRRHSGAENRCGIGEERIEEWDTSNSREGGHKRKSQGGGMRGGTMIRGEKEGTKGGRGGGDEGGAVEG